MKQILFIVSVIILSSCNNDNNDNNEQKVELTVDRFEKELFSVNRENVIYKSNEWDTIFGSFIDQVFNRIVVKDTSYYDNLLDFTHHVDYREVFDSIEVSFRDFSDVDNDLELAFGRFFHFFPSFPHKAPKITTFFSGFNLGVVTYPSNDSVSDDIAIGLEYFLGKDSKYYLYLQDPEYLRFKYQRKFIPVFVMESWFNSCFEDKLNGSVLNRDLLTQMIYKGKMMYFLDKMLPEHPLHDKFRFTKQQMDWVELHEVNLWTYIIDKDLLFSKDEDKFRQFIYDAPFVMGLPKEAPARVGYFVGYKIVSHYMQGNNISMEELMEVRDSKLFLEYYNPEIKYIHLTDLNKIYDNETSDRGSTNSVMKILAVLFLLIDSYCCIFLALKFRR